MDVPAEKPVNPRTARVRDLMLDAAVRLLCAHGAHEVTAARVAEEAEVARTTVYRQWPDRRSLLLSTLDAVTTPHVAAASTGSVEQDVRTALEGLRRRLEHHDVRALFGALAGHAAHDADFAAAQRRFVQRLALPVRDALVTAQERGELAGSVDAERESELLTAPLLHRHLGLVGDIDDALIDVVALRWTRSLEP